MLRRIIDGLLAFVRRLFGGRPTPEPWPVTTTFVNETAGAVELWREASATTPRQRFVTLDRGASHRQEASSDERWSAVDVRSGLEIAEWAMDQGDDWCVVTGVDLATSTVPGSDVGGAWVGAETALTLRNTTHLDVELVQLDADDLDHVVHSVSCPAGSAVVVGSESGQVWAARTLASDVPAQGVVPAGIELGRYLVGPIEEATYDVDNTLIGFENQSLFDVEVVEVDARGDETVRASLRPMEYVLLDDVAARAWRVRERRTGWTLVHAGPTRTPGMVEVRGASVPRGADDGTVRWDLLNTTGVGLVVEQLRSHGGWSVVARLAAGEERTAEADAGATLRARELWTRGVVGMVLAPDGNVAPAWDIAFPAASSPLSSTIEVANETWLGRVDVVHATTGATLASLAPHGTFRGTLPIGQRFYARDHRSGAVVAMGMAQRLQPVLRPTSARLRSLSAGGRGTLTVENGLGHPVDLVEVDDHGREHARTTLLPDATDPVPIRAHQVVRVTRPGGGPVLRELVTTGGAERFELEIASTPGPATTLTVVNRTKLDVVVAKVVAAGQGGADVAEEQVLTLGIGDGAVLDTHAGASYVVRDQHSGVLVGGVVAQRVPGSFDITTDQLGSAPAPGPRPVRIVDRTGMDARDLSIVAAPAWEPGHVELETSVSVARGSGALYPGALYRVVSQELGIVVAERILTPADRVWEIDADFLRTVTSPTAPLRQGEVAFHGHDGDATAVRAVAVTGSVRRLAATDRFPTHVTSIRVGDRTTAEVTATDGSDPTVVSADLATLAGTTLASGVVGCEIDRIADGARLGITHRCDLTQDYDHAGTEVTSYRTTITVPPAVTRVTMWTEGVLPTAAARPVHPEVEIRLLAEDGSAATRTLSGGRPGRVALTPDDMGTVTFSTDATSLAAPALVVQTDSMASDEVLTIRPDATLHGRMAELPPDDFHTHVGSRHGLDRTTSGHVQTAVQSLARTVRHGIVATPHGFDHVHDVGPEHMTHPHWMLDLAARTYRPLSPDDVVAATAGATDGPEPLPTNLLDDLGGALTKATHIIVHTATAATHDVSVAASSVARDVDHTVTRIGHDGERTVAAMADDLRSGDVQGALRAADNGVLSVTKDAVTGVAAVGGDVVHGAAHLAQDLEAGVVRLAVLTVRTLDGVVQYALTHSGIVGRLIEGVLHAVEVGIEEAVRWLRSTFDLAEVGATAVALGDLVAGASTRLGKEIDGVRATVDAAIASVETDVDHALDHLRAGLDHGPHKQTAQEAASRAAKAQLQWLLSHLAAASPAPAPAVPVAADDGTDQHPGLATLTSSAALEGLGDALESVLVDAVADPAAVVPDLITAVEDAADVALELLDTVLDIGLEAMAGVSEGLARRDGHVEIPVISAAFGVHRWSDIAMLLIALPVTIGYRAVDDASPADVLQGMPSGLEDLDPLTKVFGVIEVTCVALATGLTLRAVIADAEPKVDGWTWIDTFVGVVTVVAASPKWLWQGYEPPWRRPADPFQGPDKWGDVQWCVQLSSVAIAYVLTVGRKEDTDVGDLQHAIAVIQGVASLVEFVVTCVLLGAEGVTHFQLDELSTAERASRSKLIGEYQAWGAGGSIAKFLQGVLGTLGPMAVAVAVLAGPEEDEMALLGAACMATGGIVLDVRLLTGAMY